MNVNDTWEKIHHEKEWGKYPPEELIRFIMGNYKHIPFEQRKNIKILEIGCGQGANIWYLAREGFDSYGIDFSSSAIKKTYSRLKSENLTANLKTLDFNDLEYYKSDPFDAIIDVNALQSNTYQEIKHILDQIAQKLKHGGKIFSTMVAKDSFGYGLGDQVEDSTFTNIPEGPFKSLGRVTFFDSHQINDLYKNFKNLTVEYSIRSIMGGKNQIKHWVIKCEK